MFNSTHVFHLAFLFFIRPSRATYENVPRWGYFVFHFTSNNVKRERDAQANRIRRHTWHPVYFIGCDDGEGRYRVRAVLPARGARKKGGRAKRRGNLRYPYDNLFRGSEQSRSVIISLLRVLSDIKLQFGAREDRNRSRYIG